MRTIVLFGRLDVQRSSVAKEAQITSLCPGCAGDKKLMRETARRAFIAALVVGAVIVLALALWKLRLVISLLFFAFIIAAAMRPGVDALARRGVRRGAGVLI